MAKGRKTGGGSRKGIPNKRTAAQAAAIEASGMTPLDFLLSVMRDPNAKYGDRLAAARDAAPYVHAKLASITHKGDADAPVTLALQGSDVHG